MRQMNDLVKKIMEKNRKAIDEIFRIVMEDKLPTAELIKLEFESIRSLIDYSEKLALEGESAIETLEQVLLIIADMDEDERREALEDAGLDPDDYEF